MTTDLAVLGISVGAAYESIKHGIDMIQRTPHAPLQVAGGVFLAALGTGIAKNTITMLPNCVRDGLKVLGHAAEGKLDTSQKLFDDVRNVRDIRKINNKEQYIEDLKSGMAKRNRKNGQEQRFG